MKSRISGFLFIFFVFTLFAQEKIYIHKKDNFVQEIHITDIDSLGFEGISFLKVYYADFSVSSIIISEIDSITFGAGKPVTDTIKIAFSHNHTMVDNPYAYYGVIITNNNGHITVRSTTDVPVNYVLSGNTGNGSLKIYSDKKFNLIFDGVDITNPEGAAINIQSGKSTNILLNDGTVNNLTDGIEYVETDGEDMKATFFSEGQLIFDGNGMLNVKGNAKHAICSDDYIHIKNGNITVESSMKDGIHCNDYFIMDGGIVEITAQSDGIECEKGYIKFNNGHLTINSGDDAFIASYNGSSTVIESNIEINGGFIDITTQYQKGAGIRSKSSNVTINNGEINIRVEGIASKAIQSGSDITIYNGFIGITTTGSAYYDTSDKDTSSAAGVKCSGNFLIKDGRLRVGSSGSGGKGVNAEGIIVFDGGDVEITTTGSQFAYSRNITSSPKAVKSVGNLTVNNGNIVIRTFGVGAEGLESKSNLTVNGGTIDIESYDDCLNASNHIQINDGSIYCYSLANDGIDSNGTLTITGGVLVASGTNSPEAGIDCDNNRFTITGGIILGIGGSTSTPTANYCTQRSVIYRSNSITSGQFIQIASPTGDILVYKIPRTYNSMTLLFSSPEIKQDIIYTISKGGTVNGGSDFYGLYTGAIYSGGTVNDSFTASSMVTSVGSSGGSGPGVGRP